MSSIFRILLRLYPRGHRDLLGAEMQAVFEQGGREHRGMGAAAYGRFLVAELVGLLLGAVNARFAGPVPIDAPPMVASDLPKEVLEAQNRVAVNLNRMLSAIAHREFVQARVYSDEDRKARQDLRMVLDKYGFPT
jgi:hypothetical protein